MHVAPLGGTRQASLMRCAALCSAVLRYPPQQVLVLKVVMLEEVKIGVGDGLRPVHIFIQNKAICGDQGGNTDSVYWHQLPGHMMHRRIHKSTAPAVRIRGTAAALAEAHAADDLCCRQNRSRQGRGGESFEARGARQPSSKDVQGTRPRRRRPRRTLDAIPSGLVGPVRACVHDRVVVESHLHHLRVSLCPALVEVDLSSQEVLGGVA